MFKVGMKVVCVNVGNLYGPGCPRPELGGIYTINYVGKGVTLPVALSFYEMPENRFYNPDNFRPLDDTFATEVLERVAEQIKEEQLVLLTK